MMRLHYAPGSAHSAAVRIVLAEKGMACDARALDLARFEQLDPAFLALNPEGMVPVLEQDGRVLAESFPIMLFLDEAHPGPSLAGADSRERYRVHKWGKYVETHIAPNLAIVRWRALGGQVPKAARAGLDRLPRPRRDLWRRAERGFDADTVAAAAAALDKAGERLAADLAERDWLAGEAFTLADAAVFPHAIQFEALGHAPPEPVARWLTRVGERPAAAALDKEFFPIATMGPEPARWG